MNAATVCPAPVRVLRDPPQLLPYGLKAEPPPSEWAFSRPARTICRVLDAAVVGGALDIVAHPRVEGVEILSGPALICSNHASHLDAPVVRAALPARIRDGSAIAAAADYWFDGPIMRPAVKLTLGAIPFGRKSDVRASVGAADARPR